MPWIVDGDNLLGTWAGRKRSDPEKRDLAREVRRLAARERRRVVLVYDGAPPPGTPEGPDLRYAGAGRSADDVILETIRRDPDPRGWTVVTLDRSLADQARWLGASVERCEAFRARLQRDASATEKPDSAGDVAEWERIFSERPGETDSD